MSQQIEGPTRSFPAGAALSDKLRVKLSSGQVVLAGAGELSIGTTVTKAYAQGEPITVRLWSAEGTRKMIASAAITAGATVYGAASGKISSTSSGAAIGVAYEAAAADGDVIEVLRQA